MGRAMIKELLLGIIRLVLTAIYVSYRKNTTAEVFETGSTYQHTATLGEHFGEVRTVLFVSKQIKHILHYDNRMIPKRIAYTYHVDLVEYRGANVVHREYGTFPQLCSTLLNNTPYPHLCAINAYIDTYKHW